LARIVEHDTRVWLERAVIGLNLCPFAKAVHVKGQVHYAVSAAQDTQGLLADLVSELKALVGLPADERETTLLMAPHCLGDFLDFNDFLAQADGALADLDLEGDIQIASFHPQYQFAGTRVDDISNFTNRAPYPTLHLLREASIERAVESFPDPEAIFGRNMAVMQELGHAGWQALHVDASRPAEGGGDFVASSGHESS
jgi:hypothetical protein